VYAQPFSDVPHDHPFCNEIRIAKFHGVVDGHPDGSFDPTSPVSRGEAAAIIFNAAAADSGANPPPCAGDPFVDVPMDHPFCPKILVISGADVMGGFTDGTFRPADPIGRGAVAAVLTRFPYGPLPLPDCLGDPFVDVPQTNVFCRHIQFMANFGVVNGFVDGTFRPTIDVARQEFVAMLVRRIDVLEA